MNCEPENRTIKPSAWIWLILAILTLPCVIQWMVSRTYSQHNILSDMRFTRAAERASQLDVSVSSAASNLLKFRDQEILVSYQAKIKQLDGVLSNLHRSVPGSRYKTQIETLTELGKERRRLEQLALLDTESANDHIGENVEYTALAKRFDRNVQQLIGQIENRTSQTLEKTQIITSAIQYGVIAFAFVLFMTWRQHVRYVVEEERKEKHRDQLQKAKVAAEDANRIKSEFLANMSHEMRTPLTAIMGMSHLCREAEESPKQLVRIDRIENAAANLLKIVNDVLDLSKIEAGKLELESIPFHIRDVLDQVRSVVGISVDDKQLDLVVECNEDCPAVVGDPFRLNQVLTNLISNAIKFTDKGQITVKVELLEEESKITRFKFSVIDTGVGMTESQLKKIFGMFAQADGSTTRKYGGTGLGLFICKKILDAMNTEIKVVSKIGEGSEFSFELDLQSCDKLEPIPRNINTVADHTTRAEQQIIKHSVNLDRIISADNDIVAKCGVAQHVSRHIEQLESLVGATLELDLNKLPVDVRELTSELDNQLEAFDSRSVDTFSQLMKALDESDKSRLNPLNDSIQRFDFVQARQQLIKFCDSYGQSEP